MKKNHFLVGTEVYWGPITSWWVLNWWDITPSFMYCVYHHISEHLQRLILFCQFYKKVGIRSDPPPLVGTKSQVCQRKFLWGSPDAFIQFFKKKILSPRCRDKGSPKFISFDKLGILSQPGGAGVLTKSQLFCKIVKTKLTFVNGEKCDETHNT